MGVDLKKTQLVSSPTLITEVNTVNSGLLCAKNQRSFELIGFFWNRSKVLWNLPSQMKTFLLLTEMRHAACKSLLAAFLSHRKPSTFSFLLCKRHRTLHHCKMWQRAVGYLLVARSRGEKEKKKKRWLSDKHSVAVFPKECFSADFWSFLAAQFFLLD